MTGSPKKEKPPDNLPEKKSVDLTLMEQIQTLIKSGSSENKHKALDLIEREDTRLSGYYATNFFGALIFDPDTTVDKRAREICDKKIGPSASKNLEASIKLWKPIQENLKNLPLIFNNTSSAFEASQKAASQLVKNVNSPIRNIDTKKFEGYFNSIRKIGAHSPWVPPRISVSPTFWAEYYLDPVIHQKNADLTIAEALGKDPNRVAQDLKQISKSDKDIIFNYEAYPLIFRLERGLRVLITERICEKYKNTIAQKIPCGIIDEWKTRRQTERDNPYSEGDYDLIDYSDFNDLKMIIEKKSNKKDFSDKLNDQQLAGLISKLNELDPIRKKIAHSRPLTTKEFNRLKIYADDIEKLLMS